MRHAWMLLALGCGTEDAKDDDGCASFPDDASTTSRTLDAADDCGHWQLGVDEHIYINVVVTEEETDCGATAGGAIDLAYDPIYSDLEDQPPKWTYDVLGLEEGGGSLDVDCDDGTRWSGQFTVVE